MMEHMPRATTQRATNDPRLQEPIRFLIRGDLLPPEVDCQFWRRLKFIVQASKLGLSIADIRLLLKVDAVVGKHGKDDAARVGHGGRPC
jgi:hypothetical protein